MMIVGTIENIFMGFFFLLHFQLLCRLRLSHRIHSIFLLAIIGIQLSPKSLALDQLFSTYPTSYELITYLTFAGAQIIAC